MICLLYILGHCCPSTVFALNVSDAIKSRIVKRQNYGVTFTYQKNIVVYSEYYLHHFIFTLPDTTYVQTTMLTDFALEPPTIVQDGAVLREYAHNATTFRAILRRALLFQTTRIHTLLDNLFELIPEIQLSKDTKRRRAWCYVCGKMRKTLEVVALE